MNTTSQFTSSFWSIYIAVIVVLSFIGLAWLLLSQNVVKRPKKGEEVKTTGHEWDGISEYNNPLHVGGFGFMSAHGCLASAT